MDYVDLFCFRDLSGKIVGFLGVVDGKIEMLFIYFEVCGKGVGKWFFLYVV